MHSHQNYEPGMKWNDKLGGYIHNTPQCDLDCDACRAEGTTSTACNCHHGSARMCPVHTQADYDAARATTIRENITFNGHLYVHVAVCPCPEMQSEVARLMPEEEYGY